MHARSLSHARTARSSSPRSGCVVDNPPFNRATCYLAGFRIVARLHRKRFGRAVAYHSSACDVLIHPSTEGWPPALRARNRRSLPATQADWVPASIITRVGCTLSFLVGSLTNRGQGDLRLLGHDQSNDQRVRTNVRVSARAGFTYFSVHRGRPSLRVPREWRRRRGRRGELRM